METYCDYNNPKWVEKFHGLRNARYRTKIEGNTLYVIHQAPSYVPVYKKVFRNLYILLKTEKRNYESVVCMLVMCKMKESTIVDVLESYGFEIKE